MKKIYVFLSVLFCLQMMLIVSCDTFEAEPLQWNSEERVLDPADSTDNSSIKQLFYACYLNLPSLHNRIGGSYLDAATDDALPTSIESTLEYFRDNRLTAGNYPDAGVWDENYKGIRRVNLFLSKVGLFPPSSQLPASYILQMKAEARLLRAFYYFEMLKRWGGVPLLGDRVLTSEDNWNIPRNSIQEVADYITDEISPDVESSCFNDLHKAQSIADEKDPDNQGNMIGHVNQGTALGLLSRLHLYLASDLYAENDDAETRKTKWQTAADYSKRLIDLGVYGLFSETTADSVFLQFAMNANRFPNKEMIMIAMTASSNSSLEVTNAPAGAFYTSGSSIVVSNGRTSPSQNLIDAFLTKDGKFITDAGSGYNGQQPYTNRDPRLDRFIFRNGSRWLKKDVETFDGGVNRPTEGLNYTRTGYYLKKFLGNNEEKDMYGSYFHHFQIIRYTEILLNYVEALNELGDASKFNDIVSEQYGLKALRKRAGITAGADNNYGLPTAYDQDLLRRIIRNERRIELCFEEHRFYDIRRWKIAEDVMNQPVRGVRITKDEDTQQLSFSYEDAAASVFAPHMYWSPIPRAKMNANPALEQNPGWSY
jgi:hypothetical protein